MAADHAAATSGLRRGVCDAALSVSLPHEGSECGEGRRDSEPGWGLSKGTLIVQFSMKGAPPPDRRFARSRCKHRRSYILRTATKGRLCTLPTRSAGEGKE